MMSAFTTISFHRRHTTSSGCARPERGDVVITRDDRIRYNQLEREAVLAAKLRFFSITSASLTGDAAGELILSAVARITRLCLHYSKNGFIAKISRGPDVKIIEKGRK